ncbi:MAG: hypothetical protein GXY63_03915, partial [Spirochaetales bacterium]|nr:hypothetical protein [Spirochaetales bacterium]
GKSGDIAGKSGDIAGKSGDIAGKSGDIREPIRKYQTATEEQRTRIFEFLRTNKKGSNADVCKLLDVKRTRAATLLSQMVEDGLLVAEGEKKGRVYRIRGD